MLKIFICRKTEPYEDLYVDIFAKYFDVVFFHSVLYLKTGPYPLPKWFLHTERSSASSFNL